MKRMITMVLLVLCSQAIRAQEPIASKETKQIEESTSASKHHGRRFVTRPVKIRGSMETVTFGTEPEVMVVRTIGDLKPIKYGEHNYYVDKGDFYRYNGGRYLLVKPPNGLVIKKLPERSFHLNDNGKWYYFKNGIFYKAVDGGYETVAAPMDAIIYNLPQLTDVVIIKDRAYYEYLGVIYDKVLVDNEDGFQVVGELTE